MAKNRRIAPTTHRRVRRWWSRMVTRSTAMLAIGLQSLIGVGLSLLNSSTAWGSTVAVIFVIAAVNLRSSVLLGVAGVATFFAAFFAFEDHAYAIPGMVACGLASWVVFQLIERSQNARRETYQEPRVTTWSKRTGALIFGISTILAAVIFGLTKLPAMAGIAIPIAILAAAAAVYGLARVLLIARTTVPTNEGFYRVGTQLEADNMPQAIRMRSEHVGVPVGDE